MVLRDGFETHGLHVSSRMWKAIDLTQGTIVLRVSLCSEEWKLLGLPWLSAFPERWPFGHKSRLKEEYSFAGFCFSVVIICTAG